MTYTTNLHALPAPDQLPPDVGPDIPKEIKALADALDPKLTPYSQGNGTPAELAIAPGKPGRRHRDAVTGNTWLDIGAGWVMESSATAGDGIDVNAGVVSLGRAAAGGL